MKQINIAGCIEELLIFDDPEFCGEGTKETCKKLDGNDWSCRMFEDESGESQEVQWSIYKHNFLKCDQCKKAWKKAKCDCEPFQSCEKCGKKMYNVDKLSDSLEC